MEKGEEASEVSKKRAGQRKAPRTRSKQGWRLVRYVLFAVVWVFCSLLASQFVVGFIMGLCLGERISEPVWSGVYSLISDSLAVFLTVYALPRFWKKWAVSREEIGLNGLPTWTDLGLGPVGYIVSTLLAMLVVSLFSLMPWFDAEQAQNVGFSTYLVGGERIIAFIVLVIFAPVVEEVIFRGWLYGKLRSRLGMVSSILITSVLFGLMHFQWNVGVNVFCLSVVLCGMREITGTIYAGILTHMIKNGIAFYLLYVLGI